MASSMFPCKNPNRCGVKNHRSGTNPACWKGEQPSRLSQSNLMTGAIRPAASSYESDEPMTGSDLRELHERSRLADEELTRLIRLGHKQVEDEVRKEMNLGPEDGVKVVPGTLLSPVNRITVKINQVGDHERVHIQRKSKYIPTRKTDGKISMEEISNFNDERNAMNEKFDEVIKRTQEGAEEWVARKSRNTQYDEVRVVESTAMSEGEFITVDLYNKGVNAGYWRIPRSDIFRD